MSAAGLSSSCMVQAGRVERLWIDAQERMLGRLERLRRGPIAPHLQTGLRGEQAALFELRRRGVVVVARRWGSAKLRGDVDLIGWDGGTLCFYEVKTRTKRDMTPAEAAVDDLKRDMVRGLARAYLHRFPERERATIPVRFDVVSVYILSGVVGGSEVFEGAFGWR
jgi:putative endonuclease